MTNANSGRTANRGEWSEIYAFFKILVDRCLNAADENLELLPGKSFSVLQVVRAEKEGGNLVSRRYDLTGPGDGVTILDKDGIKIKIVDLSGLRTGVKEVFRKIAGAEGASFGLPEAEYFMGELLCSSVKAVSTDKTDIRLVLQDRFSPGATESGFSIKSAYKSAATLLNASGDNTNFVYRIVKGNNENAEPLEDGKVRDRMKAIYETGHLVFLRIENQTLNDNLSLIDTGFPKILATMLSHFYRKNASSVKGLTALLPNDPELQNPARDLAFYEHNVRLLLEAAALGMTPASPWNGTNQTNGGYIVVKEDGELACYHLYERSKFLDYLYEHTKFESPGTGRHGYGTVETDVNGEETIKLNLQIRFI